MERDVPVEESDYYGVLEVDPSASREVIEAAYAALKTKNDGLEAARAKAFEVLMCAVQRAEHDQNLINIFYGRNNIGGYQLLGLVSENGFSRTYNAKHIESGKLVWITQIKKLSPRSIRIFKEEVIKAWDIVHYSTSAIRDFFPIPSGQYVVVTRRIPGITLDAYVREHGKIEPKHIPWIMLRLLNPLLYFHDCGCVHAGVNPKNIVLQSRHRAFLIGSNFVGALPEFLGATAEFEKIFMPPEQLSGEKLFPEADFFSLGASMIFALTGGNLDMVRTLKIPADIPLPLREFIGMLIQKDSNYRPRWEDGDGSGLIEDLSAVRVEAFGADSSNREPLPGLLEDIL